MTVTESQSEVDRFNFSQVKVSIKILKIFFDSSFNALSKVFWARLDSVRCLAAKHENNKATRRWLPGSVWPLGGRTRRDVDFVRKAKL